MSNSNGDNPKSRTTEKTRTKTYGSKGRAGIRFKGRKISEQLPSTETDVNGIGRNTLSFDLIDGHSKTPQHLPVGSLSLFGKNPYNECMWRVVWSESRYYLVGAEHSTYDESAGGASKMPLLLREEKTPTFREKKRGISGFHCTPAGQVGYSNSGKAQKVLLGVLLKYTRLHIVTIKLDF